MREMAERQNSMSDLTNGFPDYDNFLRDLKQRIRWRSSGQP